MTSLQRNSHWSLLLEEAPDSFFLLRLDSCSLILYKHALLDNFDYWHISAYINVVLKISLVLFFFSRTLYQYRFFFCTWMRSVFESNGHDLHGWEEAFKDIGRTSTGWIVLCRHWKRRPTPDTARYCDNSIVIGVQESVACTGLRWKTGHNHSKYGSRVLTSKLSVQNHHLASAMWTGLNARISANCY